MRGVVCRGEMGRGPGHREGREGTEKGGRAQRGEGGHREGREGTERGG